MAKKGETKKGAKARTIRDRAYDGSKKRKDARVARNRARRKAIREGRAKKGDGKVQDHTTHISNGGHNSPTRTQSQEASNKQGGKISGRMRKRRSTGKRRKK